MCCNLIENCTPGVLHLYGNSCRLYIPYWNTSIRTNLFVLRILSLLNALPESNIKSNVSVPFRLCQLNSNIFKHIFVSYGPIIMLPYMDLSLGGYMFIVYFK